MIQGKQIGLRAIEFNDLKQLLEWRNRQDFRRFFRETRELNWDHQKSWYIDRVMKDTNTRMFAIVRQSDGLLLGVCGLCGIDWVNASAEVSIYIGHENRYIDDTYAPDAADVLMNHAFDELGLHRLWVEVYSFDEQKQQMFHNLGFSVDGIHPHTKWHQGQWFNSVYFSHIQR